MITDEIVKNEFKSNRYVYDPNVLKRYINKIEGKYNKDIYEYLVNRYNDSQSLKETLYRIYKGIEVHPKCPTCGKPLKFNGIFHKFCSNPCAQQSDKVKQKIKDTSIRKYGVSNYSKTKECKEKIKQTCLERYGVEYFWQSEECKEKIKQTCLERYGVEYSLQSKEIKEKVKRTCIEKYGVDNPAKLEETKEKVKQTCIKKYGTISTTQSRQIRKKIKQTCIEKYGIDNPAKLEETKEKVKQTCIKKYGGISPLSSNSIKQKVITSCIKKYGVTNYGMTDIHKCNLSKLMSSFEMQQHRHEIMKQNNTFNTSKEEDQVYKFLSQYVGVVRQFNSDVRYPFCCDFYIESLDMFIECNFHWTHGGHPFDSNSIKDQVKLEQWKSKRTKYYNNAIETWTIRDVNKRNKAKEENLNYLEFWSMKELKEYFIDYFEKSNIN